MQGRALLAEELAGSIAGNRRGEKVALSEPTAEILENFKVPGFLDPLGADFQLPPAAKDKDEVDHIVTRAIREHVCNQGPLDLDKVHGKRRRSASEVAPLPKSSMAVVMSRRLSCERRAAVRLGLAMAIRSVISS